MTRMLEWGGGVSGLAEFIVFRPAIVWGGGGRGRGGVAKGLKGLAGVIMFRMAFVRESCVAIHFFCVLLLR